MMLDTHCFLYATRYQRYGTAILNNWLEQAVSVL